MKRFTIAAMAAAIAALATASAYASDDDLTTNAGRRHFWEEHKPESGGN